MYRVQYLFRCGADDVNDRFVSAFLLRCTHVLLFFVAKSQDFQLGRQPKRDSSARKERKIEIP